MPKSLLPHVHVWRPWGADIDQDGRAFGPFVYATCDSVDRRKCDECKSATCRCQKRFTAEAWNRGKVI